MRFPARLAAPCAALLLIFALAPRPLAAQSGAIGIRGDVNRDGGVTAVDALAVLSHVVGKPLPATYTVAQDGDADGNGQVTALDALVILGHAVGKDVARYPVGRRILSGTVGSAGGAVVSPGDSIRLDFPEGALAGEVTVTVQPAAGMAADGGKLPGAILELGPSGQRFAKPVRLTLRFDPASVPQGVPASELRIHRREGDGWAEVPGGSVDVANGTVAAELSGFSTYAVMPRAASGRGLTLAKEAGDAQTGVAGRPPADFLVARLTNAAGRGMQGVELAWTVTEGGGSIRPLETRTDGEGRVRAVFTLGAVPGANAVRVSAAGAEAVVFTATGVADAPAAATVVAGADQTAVAGTAVATPPAVRVTDSSGNPVVDVAVTFTAATGGGSVAGGATRTDAGGVATVGSWTLGTTAGPNTLAAAVQGGPTATIAAVGLPGAAAAVSVRSGDGGTATVATTRALEAKVVDAHGNGVPGVTVAWAVATGGGSLAAPTSATDAAGVASAAWTLGGTTGTQTATASAAGLAGSPLTFTVATTPAAASQLVLAAQPSATARSGIALAAQPVAQLRDAFGNAVPQAGVAVTAAIASGGGTLGGTSTVSTDASGAATFTDLAISGTVGQRTLAFSAGGLTGATSNAIDVAAGTAAGLAVAAGDGQTATAGSAVAVAPSVRVVDASGNPVSGVGVAFAVASGGGSVAGASATTDASGVAAVGSWTLGATAGANTLTASSTGLASVAFGATGVAGAAAAIAVHSGDGGSAQVGTTRTLEARVTDANGNPVQGTTVSWAVAAGGGSLGAPSSTTDAAGVASATWTFGTTAGAQGATASAAGLAGSPLAFAATATPAPASRLAVATQPSASARSGIDFAAQPVVQLQDAFGNAVAQSGVTVTAAIATGTGTLGGTPTAATDAAGRATFAGLSISGATGAYTLGFTAAGLADAASGTITLAAGNPAALVVATQPSATAQSGIAFATQPAVQLRDASGNAVSQAGITVTAAIASGGGTLGGTATVGTNASGQATFSGLSISGTVGDRTLSFSAGGVTGATSNTISITAGAASQLVVTTQPSATVQNGAALATQPVVQLRDADGNTVAQAGVAVTAAIASGGGTLGGTTTVATSASGVATFSGLSISGTVGDRTLSFSAGGVTGATSNTIGVTAGAASQLVITRQPSSTVQNGSFLGTAPVLRLRDASGNDVAQAGVSVTVAIASGGPVLSGTTVQSTDAAGQVVFGGLVITGAAGDRTLGFTAAGLAGDTSSAITVTPGPAATIGIDAGDGQTATAGSAVSTAPSVIVRDVSNNPVPGVSVAFAVASGGGSVTGGTATTGASGIATVGSWTLGTTAGANTLTASSGGLTPATFTATGVAGPAAAISIQSGDGGTAVVASTRTLEAKVVDANGNPVAGHVVSWAAATGGGSVSAPTSTTSAAGVASVGWTLGTAAGAQTATATSAGLAGSPLTFTATTTAAAAAAGSSTLAASPASITADGSSASTLTVQLRDAYGNAVGASAGTVALSATSGTLSAVTDNGNGTYTATLTAPTAVGSSTVSGTLNGGALAGTATVAFVPGAAARYTVTPSAATATAGGTVTITAQLVDANGNAVPAAGRTVTWSSANGGSFASPTSTTDAAGVATVVFTTSTTAGTTHTVTADDRSVVGTSGSVVTQTGAASAIVKSGADGVSLAAGSAVTPLPTVRVTDANGNGVPGVSVVFAVTAGGGSVTGTTQTTDATGAATVGSWTLGTTAGANTLSATAGSLSASFAVTGTVGPASAAGTQITTANAALTSGSITTVTVQVRDQYGNALTTGGATVALATDLGTVGPVTDVGNGTYTADLTHTGTNGVATVTGTLGGTPITDNAQVSFQAGGIQRTWTGLAGSSWSTAGSWSPRGTPTSSDTIVINGGGTQPQVTDADKTILRLVMTSAGGTLDLGGFKLVVTGDAVASGGVVSNGVVQMSGSSRSIQGTVPNLLVTGSVSASGSTVANGTVTVSNGSLTVSNTTLTIKGQ
jgi:adhesin/invasin